MSSTDQPPTGETVVDPTAAPAEAFRVVAAAENDAPVVGDAASSSAPQDAAGSKDVSMTDAPPESAAVCVHHRLPHIMALFPPSFAQREHVRLGL